MKVTKTIDELMKNNSSPLPIDCISHMGIKLVLVKSITWEKSKDAQLKQITINFR